MKRTWIKFLLFLLPAIAGVIFLVWYLSPTRAVVRRADAILATIEWKTVSLSGGPRDNAEKLKTFLSPDFELKAPRPVPSGSLSPDAAGDLLQQFQSSVTSCKISRDRPTVAFPGPGEAIFQATIDIDILIGRSSRRVLRYRCRFEFEKVERTWLLRRAVLTPI